MMNRLVIVRLALIIGVFVLSWVAGRAVILENGAASVNHSTTAGAVNVQGIRQRALSNAQAEADPLDACLRMLEWIASVDSAELSALILDAKAGEAVRLSAARRWAETDPVGFFRFLRGVNRNIWAADPVLAKAMGVLFRAWVVTDSEAALAAAREAGVKPEFRFAIQECVQALLLTDPAKAIAAADDLPFSQDPFEGFPTKELEKNPAAFLTAIEHGSLKALSSTLVRNTVMKVFQTWVKQDPSAAARWLDGTPRNLRKPLWNSLTGSLAEADREFTRAWIENLPPSGDRETAGAMLVQEWGKTDSRGALAWLQDHLKGYGRTEAFSLLARTMVYHQSMDSARQLLEAMPPGQARDGVLSSVAAAWVQNDAKAAAAWVLPFPEEDPGRHEALRGIGSNWVRKDPEGVAAYLREHPDDRALSLYADHVATLLAQKDMRPALEWALSLGDHHRRNAFGGLFWNSSNEPRFAEIASLAEALDANQRQTLAEEILEKTARTKWGSPPDEEKYLRAVATMPAGVLREAYLSGLEKAGASPERVEKIKGYFKEAFAK